MLAQLLRQNGCSQVTIAAPKGLKMDLARSLEAADTYIELSRTDPGPQFEQLKKDNPHGFDIGGYWRWLSHLIGLPEGYLGRFSYLTIPP